MAGRVPVRCRSGTGLGLRLPNQSGFKTCRTSRPAVFRTCGFQDLRISEPAGPQDLRFSEPADFSASGRPRRVLRAGFRAKHARAASSPAGKMPLSFSFRCNSRPIPMYIPELRCIPAYSGIPVFRLQFGVSRPQFGVFRSYSGRERRLLQPAQKNFTGRPSMAESRLLAADEAPMRKRSVVSHSLPRISSTIV